MNVNKTMILGNLTRDPEMRSLPSGQNVASFSIATNRYWTDRESGQKKSDTQFHNIVAFGRLAEVAGNYLKKGALAFVEGRLQTRSWNDKDGNKKYRTEIVAERLQLGPRSGDNQGKPAKKMTGKKEEKKEEPEQEEEINIEEIPF